MSATFRPGDWYEMPLYYDIVFAEGTATDADFLVEMLERHGPDGGRRVLEPACGTGRLVVELAARGLSVAGFDAAPAMLEFAQLRLVQEKLRAGLSLQRMEGFTVPGQRFDLAHCLLSTFKYLLDADDARRHLERVRDHLNPGGIYVLGVHLANYCSARVQHERWVASRGGTRVTCNTRTYPPDGRTRRETIRNRLTIEADCAAERFESTWECRTYNAAELHELIASVPGLSPVATYDFNHDAAAPITLDDTTADVVVVLRATP